MNRPTGNDTRFAFGENWLRFIQDVAPERITIAESSLREKLDIADLRGRTFLDVGCGSGLFSLAATRLGADHVHSFDYDEKSVNATALAKDRHAPGAAWTIERGDATSDDYMASLGQFDIVYAWGVLHHTGAMWQAMENAVARVARGGLFFVAIYNDQGRTSRRWRAIKKLYNRLPGAVRVPYAIVVMLPLELRKLASATLRGRPWSYVTGWTRPRERGMSRWNDLLDWVGGYPFEVAKPEEVFLFCRERGFELMNLATCAGELGNNQFVFRRNS